MEGKNKNIDSTAQSGTVDLEAIKNEIANKQTELDNLNVEISSKHVELSKLKEQIGSSSEVLSNLDAEIAAKAETLSDLKDQIEELQEVQVDESVDVEFQYPSFRHNGVVYKSKDVEAAAEQGDVSALELIQALIKSDSGILKVTKLKGGK